MGRKLGTGSVMGFGSETQVSRGQEAQGCYCMAFSTAYVRRRWVVEIRFGSVCCAWVLLYRENTVKTRTEQSPGRTGNSAAVVAALLLLVGVGITHACATRAEADTCSRKAWVAAAVAVSGAEEGSADDVVGLAGAPGSSTLPKACLGEWAVVLDSRASARDRWLHPG